MNTGRVQGTLHLYAEAIINCEQSLAIWRELSQRIYEGRVLDILGDLHSGQEHWEEALVYYNQGLSIHREFGERIREGWVLNNIAHVYWRQERWEEAFACYEQNLAICRELRDHTGEGGILWSIALVREAQNNIPGALQYARQALQALQSTKNARFANRVRYWIHEWENLA